MEARSRLGVLVGRGFSRGAMTLNLLKSRYITSAADARTLGWWCILRRRRGERGEGIFPTAPTSVGVEKAWSSAEIMAKDLVGRGFAGSSRCRGIFVRDRLRSLDIDGFVGLAESLKSYQKMTSSQDP